MGDQDAFSILCGSAGAKKAKEGGRPQARAGAKRKAHGSNAASADARARPQLRDDVPASLINWTATPSRELRKSAKPAQDRSGSLHDFFGGKDHTAPSVLYLGPGYRAKFCRRLPADAARLALTTRWAGKDLVLAYHKRHLEGSQEWVPGPSQYRNQAQLKSHIQVRWLHPCMERNDSQLAGA